MTSTWVMGKMPVRRKYSVVVRRTGIFPITHVLVMRQGLYEKHPDLTARLYRGFEDAEALCRESYAYAKRLAFPGAVMVAEEEEAIFGQNPWAHGLTQQNVALLEKFIRYAEEQGYIAERPRVADLFTPVPGFEAKAAAEAVSA